MNMKDWLKDLEREIDRRVAAAIKRESLSSSDELLECRTAPDGERVYFSIRGMLEDNDGSQDPGWQVNPTGPCSSRPVMTVIPEA